jgi:hypothetical protein
LPEKRIRSAKRPIDQQPQPSITLNPDAPMEDPFTEQAAHPAGDGQGANRVQPRNGVPGENAEEAIAVEEGFSPIP